MPAQAQTRRALPEWPEWMDVRTLGRYCCASTRTLREWALLPDNPMPTKRVGGKLFVARTNFDSWMQSHASAGPGQDLNAIVEDIVASVTGGK
jgi:hypothetical protein